VKEYKFKNCNCCFPIREDLPYHNGEPPVVFNPYDIPLDCPATWDLICSGKVKGCFQIDGSLGITWVKRISPRSIADLGAILAIIRPGVLNVKDSRGVSATEQFARFKNGEEEIVWEIPELEPILGYTYSILIFQEQLIGLSKLLADFTALEADALRKAAGKKSTAIFFEMEKLFIDKAEAKGIITREQAIRLFDGIKRSARYLFVKTHAYSYAIETYKTAFAKIHFPRYFYTSWLDVAKEKSANALQEIKDLCNDARRAGYLIEPPLFVNLNDRFIQDGQSVLFSLLDIKDIGLSHLNKMKKAVAAVEPILGPRESWTWFQYLTEFSDRISITANDRMISVGALRTYEKNEQGFQPSSKARLYMLAELSTWNSLTTSEKTSINFLDKPLYEYELVKDEVQVTEPKWPPKFSKEEKVKFTPEEAIQKFGSKTTKNKQTRHDESGKPIYQIRLNQDGSPLLLDSPRPIDNLPNALEQLLLRPDAVRKDRRDKVASLLSLLVNPPNSLKDTPSWMASTEENYLGVSLTYSRTEVAAATGVNCTCRDYAEEREKDPNFVVILGEITRSREHKTKSGKNIGSLMGFVSLQDDSGSIDCVLFPEVWEDFGGSIVEGQAVKVSGKRGDKGSLVINSVEKV
jgi:DNA polymerase III alpha subunit